MQTTFVGTITWFDKEEAVGYIRRRTGADVYAQFSDMTTAGFKGLIVGQKVEFNIENTANGLIAKNIVPC